MKDPTVSVIIPIYNGEKYIKKALDSIFNQRQYVLEIIVIDDGATDLSLEIISNYNANIQIFSQKNQGPAAARNTGIKKSKGELITFLDADDIWENNKLERHIQLFDQHPEAGIIQGLVQQIAEKKEMTRNKVDFTILSAPYNFVNLGAATYRKSTFEKVGYFDESMRFAEDVDWFHRAREENIVKIINSEVALYYRIHQENMTNGKSIHELGYIDVYKKRLDRIRKRRKQGGYFAKPTQSIEAYLGCPPNHKVTELLQ